jgi:hypothetical protein
MIRSYARRTNRTLGDVTQTIVTNPTNLPELASTDPPP